MKKKLKDFTLGEMKQICDSHDCYSCPFKYLDYCFSADDVAIDDLEQEYELEVNE